MPRGQLLGGSSAINGMAFVRGQAQDFDTWAQMGNHGWSYDDVLPFFKRMERYEAAATTPSAAATGRCASPIRDPRDPIFAHADRGGGPGRHSRTTPTTTARKQDGIAMSQATSPAGRRMSTARCYLDPIRSRTNLRIETGALTEALLLDGKRCTGVRYSVGGTVA